MRLAIIAPALALRAGLHALIDFPASAEDRVVLQAASLDEYAAAGVEADVLLVAGDAVQPAALRSCLEGITAQPGLLALSDHPELMAALPDLPLRGWAILPLDASADELQAALRAVDAGLAAGTPALFRAALRRPLQQLANDPHPGGEAATEALTERESQVLQHLGRGLPNKQIALALGISEHTVKFHISAIYTKLGANNRTEAVRAGIRQGLIVL
jgi:DNA-binding NarL/FixJ family response regulator